jgi:hypothetical protein
MSKYMDKALIVALAIQLLVVLSSLGAIVSVAYVVIHIIHKLW